MVTERDFGKMDTQTRKTDILITINTNFKDIISIKSLEYKEKYEQFLIDKKVNSNTSILQNITEPGHILQLQKEFLESSLPEIKWLDILNKVFSIDLQESWNKLNMIEQSQFKPPISFETLEKMDLPPIEWFIDGFIVKNGIMYWGADSGIGKSLTTEYLAMCFAYDQPFLGRNLISDGRPIVICDEENRLITLKQRLVQIKNSFGTVEKKCDLILYVDRNVKLDAGTQKNNDVNANLNLSEFKSQIKTLRPQIIFIDSFVRFFTGDENFSSEVRVVFDCLKEIVNDCNCSIVILHHTIKNGNKNNKNALRGSGEISASADIVFMMEKNDRHKNLVLTQVKNRHQPEINPIIFDIKSDKESIKLTLIGELLQKKSKKDLVKEIIKGFCKDTLFTYFKKAQLKDILKDEGFDLTSTNVKQALAELVNEGFLGNDKKGSYTVSATIEEEKVFE